MSARDDYLELADLADRRIDVASADASDALDMMDQLRAEVHSLNVNEVDLLNIEGDRLREVIVGLNEMIRELTAHTDALRALVVELDTEIEQTGEAANLARYSHNERLMKRTLAAYDQFIKEA